VLGAEFECSTLGFRDGERLDSTAVGSMLVRALADLAPSLSGPAGIFLGYGRAYVDCAHFEFALAECASPYELASLFQRFEGLLERTIERVETQNGIRVELADDNHSGLLSDRTPTWGSHENYLVERPPKDLTARMLPFLASRLYAGAGGVLHPGGSFVASVRSRFLRLDVGGSTTEARALFCTSRQEHHVGRRKGLYRCHLIGADGHRSHFNLALQFGATALALKAAMYDARLSEELEAFDRLPAKRGWTGVQKSLGRLTRRNRPIGVDPRAVRIQRVYLAAAERYAASLAELPAWIERTLDDWRRTLAALEREDRDWLAARLDAFAKYELLDAFLAEAGASWSDVAADPALAARVALLEHDYHVFGRGPFAGLEAAELLDHRVGAAVEPGAEAEPFVPDTATRARARARFLAAHRGDPGLVMDWDGVVDLPGLRRRDLSDPFAEEYGPWKPWHEDEDETFLRAILRRPARGPREPPEPPPPDPF